MEPDDYLLLKWGTLKGWGDLSGNPKAVEAFERYHAGPVSMGAMIVQRRCVVGEWEGGHRRYSMTYFLASSFDMTSPERIREIERALKLDPDREYRKQLVREYLDLTDLEPKKDIDL